VQALSSNLTSTKKQNKKRGKIQSSKIASDRGEKLEDNEDKVTSEIFV
jgi:hypothetical protein